MRTILPENLVKRIALTISTAHIPAEDPEGIAALPAFRTEFGWGIYTFGADPTDPEIPEWYRPIAALARDAGADFIFLDCDGETVEGLTVYPWAEDAPETPETPAPVHPDGERYLYPSDPRQPPIPRPTRHPDPAAGLDPTLRAILDVVYPAEDPERSWDPDTIETVAALVMEDPIAGKIARDRIESDTPAARLARERWYL